MEVNDRDAAARWRADGGASGELWIPTARDEMAFGVLLMNTCEERSTSKRARPLALDDVRRLEEEGVQELHAKHENGEVPGGSPSVGEFDVVLLFDVR